MERSLALACSSRKSRSSRSPLAKQASRRVALHAIWTIPLYLSSIADNVSFQGFTQNYIGSNLVDVPCDVPGRLPSTKSVACQIHAGSQVLLSLSISRSPSKHRKSQCRLEGVDDSVHWVWKIWSVVKCSRQRVQSMTTWCGRC